MQLLSSNRLSLTALLVIVPCLVTTTKGDCFDNDALFEYSARYVQLKSFGEPLYYWPADRDTWHMTVESKRKDMKIKYICQKSYDDNRMRVEVKIDNEPIKYQCLHFKVVSKHVLRIARTTKRRRRKKVNCYKDKYTTDDAVLVALDFLLPKPCPLQGGYQLIMHEGETIPGNCLGSVKTYNPNIRFQCDNRSVIADFGRACEPSILRENQELTSRRSYHLHCVASWDETDTVKSVLLRSRDMPFGLWCLHYRLMDNNTDFIDMFVSFDGRCAEGAFNNEKFPSKTSVFGQLASYVPLQSPACSDQKYLDSCIKRKDVCLRTKDCPASCQRCNTKPAISECQFPQDILGVWSTTDTRFKMPVEIKVGGFTAESVGEFLCYGGGNGTLLPSSIFPVMQADDSSTCLPYYACAAVENPSPGILFFKVWPAPRDEDSGHASSCKEMHKSTDDSASPEEKMVTLLNPSKIEKKNCGLNETHLFPTFIDNCILEIEGCDGSDCTSLKVGYFNNTSNSSCVSSMSGLELETDHDCLGQIYFDDGVHGLLTYSEPSNMYLCWIFDNDHLYITSPKSCNRESVLEIILSRDAARKYDPIQALVVAVPGRSKSKDVQKENDENCASLLHRRSFSIELYYILVFYCCWCFLIK